ncbi:helix-turn-helix domain-containing protein [Pseudonocardia sp. N23]|uniref:AraC-like ligand-binding domain-containing protein n=1 Tax=Pseudonocardia sp. N23 TaxID=1987376 RepID=UPI000BFD7424|nr:helix-turn-helix domain-containing protein [Pseudonocardia sp. N23]GAY12446.1 transcriptional regulator, AraC family [Pseudonocardia sp. N23]
MSITTIDTTSVAERDRLDFWRSTVCDQFVTLDVRPASGTDVRGRVTAVSMADTQLRKIAAGAHSFERTSHQVRAADEDYFQIALARKGRTLVTQDGREAVIGPGDFVLYDSARPFRFVTAGDFEYSVCLFPTRLLPLSRSEMDSATAIRFDGRSGIGAMVPPLLAALHRLDAESLPPASRTAMMQSIGDMYVALVRSRVDAAAAPNVHLMRAQAWIDEHLDDPGLAPGDVAAACSISVSYLHKLFGETGTSVAAHVRERRLQGCFADLARPELARLTVGAIGARWGLPDAAHLSRAFRARFGVSPSEHRTRT